MRSPAAEWAFNDYRLITIKGKRKVRSPHVAGCRVERRLLECKSDEGVAGMVPCG